MSGISETRSDAGGTSIASGDIVDATETTSTSKDDIPYNPIALSTNCLIKCILNAYANDGNATIMAL
ncbi:hypothetical protein BFJ63_vAg17833 [Fusarium oxysporum f. sp. narcissi]|uniref:Uncharacterized protein n=1 Tax=Fusarium oxysporum f. sp. narcissi TaxID=451672 RepID=A0A4V1RXU1_FUSOX|nr:hypothetical protein BFJ63_vAg17833 [Fusarium oxysporum f. sp. narcissi]